jgi:hypothetical protein
MIGFNYIGRLGRIGNQMFQYAALRGIAAKQNVNYCLPFYKNPIDDGLGNPNRTELFDCFKMETVNPLNIQILDYDRPIISEETFHYNEKFFKNSYDWIGLFGFFQSEKYFKNVEKIIRKDFIFKDEIREPCEEMMRTFGDEEVVGLHIRRQDYLTNPNHCTLDMLYYKKALGKFDDSMQVIVFSDDPNWCHQQDLFQNDRFLISENNNGYIDQCLMSMCSHFIIANSSFSWWASWIGNRGKVIAPKKWFPNNKNDTKDLYLENWEVI